MVADAEALRIAYQDGIIGDAKQWAKVPMIDWRGNDNSNIHMNWRAFAVRDRLDRVNGGHGNQVIWRYGPGLLPPPQLMVDSLVTIDKWVAAIKADTSATPLEQKVVKNRPAEAFDFCYIGNDYTTKVTDWSKCDADPVLKYFASPRQVAGGPLAEDVLKCQLKPLKRSDYATTFSDEQWTRLSKVFAGGVCDWSKPGVACSASTPWRTFAKGRAASRWRRRRGRRGFEEVRLKPDLQPDLQRSFRRCRSGFSPTLHLLRRQQHSAASSADPLRDTASPARRAPFSGAVYDAA